jgi:hypothetical protein
MAWMENNSATYMSFNNPCLHLFVEVILDTSA